MDLLCIYSKLLLTLNRWFLFAPYVLLRTRLVVVLPVAFSSLISTYLMESNYFELTESIRTGTGNFKVDLSQKCVLIFLATVI